MSTTPSHPWNFFRAGGFDQVDLQSGADIANLDQLDQTLWVALACPATGLEFDPATLALIDSNNDGRIRAPDVIATSKWTTALLKDSNVLMKGSETLKLSDIDPSTPDGAAILASAKHILSTLDKADREDISLQDIRDIEKIFAQTLFNGDGIVPADSADDEATKSVIQDIIQCNGPETDRSGKPGVNLPKMTQFFNDLNAYSDWWALHENEPENILPLGEGTESAFAVLNTVKTKIDDYFARCNLAAFDERALMALNRQETEYLEVASKDLSITASEVESFPIARVEADKALSLKAGINPAWVGAVDKFANVVVAPLLGEKTVLTEKDWKWLCEKFAPFAGWTSSKSGAQVESLGLHRIREILSGPSKGLITELIAKDQALETEFNAIVKVEKLIRLHRDLIKLLFNFVSFRDFYATTDKAIFQIGTLFIDTRSCELCLLVRDSVKHAKMAALAGSYIAYCTCVRAATGEKMEIAAILTNGDCDNLMVGRNGVFYDRKGQDWDATITKIVDNPISIQQAFWHPYKKLIRMVEEMAAKRAAAAEANSDSLLQEAAKTTVNADQTKVAAPKKVDVGTVAAISVAIAGIGALITAIIGHILGLIKLPFWQFCLALTGILLLVSGPSMIIAWLKLRKRNLGPLLDANGWAINAKATMNVPFGASLTKIATLPKNSKSSTHDEYGEKPYAWFRLVAVTIVVCFIFSLLNHFCVWDRIVYKTTGKHYPEFFKPVSSIKAPAINVEIVPPK